MGVLTQRAVHEAGHALVARLMGRKAVTAQVVPTPEVKMQGVELPRGAPKTDAERAAMEGALMIAVAGLCAERVLAVADPASTTRALDDLGRATDLAVRLKGRERAERVVHHFVSVVERMLRARTDTLRTVAEALDAEGALDAAALEALTPRR